MANKCVSATELIATVKRLAAALTSTTPLALAAAKSCVNFVSESNIEVAIDHELNEFLRLFWTNDQKEGMRAFLEKRKPEFNGS